MPTSTSISTSARKPRSKAARKPKAAAARRSSSAARASTTGRTTQANGRSTQAKARRARAARTRASHDATAAVRNSQVASREGADVFGDYAERAVLIQVGAALIARERVVSTVSDAFSNYSSTSRAQAQLRRFERRGVTARNRLEREVRKARVRVERELRQRRRGVERTVNDLDARREAVAKNGSDLANRVQERILSLV